MQMQKLDRWVEISGRQLVRHKKKGATPNGTVRLDSSVIVTPSSDGKSWSLRAHGEKFTFSAKSGQLRDDWLKHISDACAGVPDTELGDEWSINKLRECDSSKSSHNPDARFSISDQEGEEEPEEQDVKDGADLAGACTQGSESTLTDHSPSDTHGNELLAEDSSDDNILEKDVVEGRACVEAASAREVAKVTVRMLMKAALQRRSSLAESLDVAAHTYTAPMLVDAPNQDQPTLPADGKVPMVSEGAEAPWRLQPPVHGGC